MKVKQYRVTTKVKIYQAISNFFTRIGQFFFFQGLKAFEKSAVEVEMTEDEYDQHHADQAGLSLEEFRSLRAVLAAKLESEAAEEARGQKLN